METAQTETRPYLRFDFGLASKIGTSPALVLAALINHYEYFKSTNQLKDGKFFNTKEMIALKTNLGPSAILKAEKVLVKFGFISISPKKGKAGKLNDYTIHFDVLNQPLECIKPFPKTDLTIPKDRLNHSLGMDKSFPKNEESYQTINLDNNHKESTERINTDNNHKESTQTNYMSDDYWNNVKQFILNQ